MTRATPARDLGRPDVADARLVCGRGLAERLRRAVQDLRVVLLDRRLQITVSIGLAGCRAQQLAPNLDSLLAQADQALYRAKAAGRNRIVQAEAQRQVV